MGEKVGTIRWARIGATISCIGALALLAVPAGADTYWGSSGALEAEAVFEIVDGNLQITLTNTASMDVMNTSQLLTGVFWDYDGTLSLVPLSAILADGSEVWLGTTNVTPSDAVVGGEWAYRDGLPTTITPGGTSYGIASSGFSVDDVDVFGPDDLFPPSIDLDYPPSPDGSNFGITSATDILATGNGGLENDPIIQNSVVFTLDILGVGFDLGKIENVWFQYGTSLTEPHYSAVPVPPAVGIGLFGMGILGAIRARKRWAA